MVTVVACLTLPTEYHIIIDLVAKDQIIYKSPNLA